MLTQILINNSINKVLYSIKFKLTFYCNSDISGKLEKVLIERNTKRQ